MEVLPVYSGYAGGQGDSSELSTVSKDLAAIYVVVAKNGDTGGNDDASQRSALKYRLINPGDTSWNYNRLQTTENK